MQDLRFVLSPYVCMQAIPNPSPYIFFLYGGPKYVGSQVCNQFLRMYVGYTESFSVCFFCTIKFLCIQVEQNICNVNILLTCADNRNNDETSTFMDGGPSNCRWGPDLTACLVGLRSHSRLHRGRCLTRTGPKYVGSLVCTESLRMNVGYTNSFSLHFFVNTYNTVHIVLIKIHIVFTIAYNTY